MFMKKLYSIVRFFCCPLVLVLGQFILPTAHNCEVPITELRSHQAPRTTHLHTGNATAHTPAEVECPQ